MICWYLDNKRHGVLADIYGTVLNFFRGILVPKEWAVHPEKIDLEEVLRHPNTEVRYAGMEIYGYKRMYEEGLFTILHKDHKLGQELIQYKGKSGKNLEEPITLVKVLNSTPEDDGTQKIYFLSVPPDMKTCAQAVAWTFNKDTNTYHPGVET
jgi:hypothetical protein